MKNTAAWMLLLSIALVAGDCDDDCDCDEFFFVTPVNAPFADLNVDGFADLVIGAPGHDGRGAVFVYFGTAAGPSPTPSLTILGAEDDAQFGASIAFVGDVNGQGAPDLLVGAPLDDGDGTATEDGADRGRAFVFFGGPAMDANPDVTLSGAEIDGQFGSSVAPIGDTNHDGFEDWIIGAPLDDGDGNATDEGIDRGRAFFYFGSFTPNADADVTFTGTEVGSEFGSAVESAGDINGGGADDIAVGAPFDDGDGNGLEDDDNLGRVYVFFGGSVLDPTPDLTLTGDERGGHFGAAVAPVFDVNGDGVDDLLVGAPEHNGGGGANANRGRAYVYFGGSAPDAVADLTMSGSTDGGAFGAAVSRAGDIDGDQVGDFVVGAPLEDPSGRADAGSAYLFLSSPSVDGVPDLAFDGAEAGGEFGAAVAGPGDINQGGRDLIIGAPFDDAGGIDRGRVFVFFGGAALDGVADATVSGAQDGAHAGAAIAN